MSCTDIGSYYSANPKNPRLCPPGAVNNCCPPYANLALKESEKLPSECLPGKAHQEKTHVFNAAPNMFSKEATSCRRLL